MYGTRFISRFPFFHGPAKIGMRFLLPFGVNRMLGSTCRPIRVAVLARAWKGEENASNVLTDGNRRCCREWRYDHAKASKAVYHDGSKLCLTTTFPTLAPASSRPLTSRGAAGDLSQEEKLDAGSSWYTTGEKRKTGSDAAEERTGNARGNSKLHHSASSPGSPRKGGLQGNDALHLGRKKKSSASSMEPNRSAASLTKRLTAFSSSSGSDGHASSSLLTMEERQKKRFRPRLHPGESIASDTKDSSSGWLGRFFSKNAKGKTSDRRSSATEEKAGGEGKVSHFARTSGRFNKVAAEKGLSFAFVLYMLGEAMNVTVACIWHLGYLGNWMDVRYLLLLVFFYCGATPVKRKSSEKKSVERTNGEVPPATTPMAPAGDIQENAEATMLSQLIATWTSRTTTFTVAPSSSTGDDNIEDKKEHTPANVLSTSSMPTCVRWVEWLDKGPYLWDEQDIRLSLRFAFHYAVVNVLLKPCYPYQYQCCEKILVPMLQNLRSFVSFSFKKAK